MKAYSNTIITKEQHNLIEEWLNVRLDYTENPKLEELTYTTGFLFWKKVVKKYKLVNVPSYIETFGVKTFSSPEACKEFIALNEFAKAIGRVFLMSVNGRPVMLDDEMYSIIYSICENQLGEAVGEE